MQIEVGSLIALAVTFSAALLVSWTLLVPFFSNEADDELDARDGDLNTTVQLSELQRRKDNAIAALEELEHELASGKIAEEEYTLSKAELTREAAQYIKRLEDAQRRTSDTEEASGEGPASEEAREYESNSH